MRKVFSGILAAIMLLTAMMGAALAGQGDQTLLSLSNDDGYTGSSIQNVLMEGDKIYFFLSGMSASLEIYDMETGTLETWDMTAMYDAMRGLSGEEAETTETAEDTEEPGARWTEDAQCWFAKDGELYALVIRYLYEADSSQMDGGHVRKLILEDGLASLAKEDTWTLDWTGMTETSGSWVSSRYISSSGIYGDRLFTSSYDNNGNQSLQVFDLTTGGMEERIIPELNEFGIAADGRLLISQYNWGEDAAQIISVYDPDSESLEPLARFSLNDGSVSMFAWQPETDTMYFLRNGEIYAAPGGDIENAQAVNDCPSTGRFFAPILPDGRILVWSYNFAMLRNTDPSLRSETTLRIRPFAWSRNLESTTFAFANEHTDIAVIREDWGNESTLLQSMMNRDGSVDIYLISLDSHAFNSILDRGFAADLSSSAKIMDAVEKMYPFVKENLSRNGKLVAIPLDLGGDAMGYNPRTLEALGMTEEDLPKTWNQFFDFLSELPDRLAGTEFRAFELYTYQSDLQNTIFRQILNQYILLREDAPFNSEELRALLERLQKIDFAALGILSEEELNRVEEEGGYMELGGNKEALLNTYADVSVASYQYNLPIVLGLAEGEDPAVPCSMSVAFINPYSEHQAEAVTFLESMLDHLDTETKYSLNPDLNEPVRYPSHEESKKYLQKYLKQAQDNLAAAEDDETREQWTQIVDEYQKALDEFDQNNWMISPTGIASYRARAQYLRLLKWNMLNDIYNMDGGDQYWQLRDGFFSGTSSVQELLSFIDKKVQMMRLEGD